MWDSLACPDCGEPLARSEGGAGCISCGSAYSYTDWGALDLRVTRPIRKLLEFNVGPGTTVDLDVPVRPLVQHPSPQVDFEEIVIPHHLTKDLMSYFPQAQSEESLMLDLGSGSGIHREICEHAGFEYVSLDYYSKEAQILGDAHALPCLSNTFEMVLSIAVLEHIQYPFVMMREVHKVLKPAGKLIGTVAFMEPFHGNSYYHHSHLGTLNSLKFAGLKVEQVASSISWSVLKAQAHLGLFPAMPPSIANILIFPLYLLHRLWWLTARRVDDRASEERRILKTSGSFSFIAAKEPK